jgi:hypothetical protein
MLIRSIMKRSLLKQTRGVATISNLESLKKRANDNDKHAQYELACIYHLGSEVDTNITEALKWYKKSAENGFKHAQRNLGILYTTNKEIQTDYIEGIKWFSKACDQGCKDSSSSLGSLYVYGFNADPNIKKGIKIMRINESRTNTELIEIRKKNIRFQQCLNIPFEKIKIALKGHFNATYIDKLIWNAGSTDKQSLEHILELWTWIDRESNYCMDPSDLKNIRMLQFRAYSGEKDALEEIYRLKQLTKNTLKYFDAPIKYLYEVKDMLNSGSPDK